MNNNNVGFLIEPTNICTLKCPGCQRTRFIKQWGDHWKNHSVDVKDLLNFLDCDLTNVPITLGGNSGDPIYHADFHNLVYSLKQQGAIISITTNGSYKTNKWWVQLCDVLDEKDTIMFSIDGLPTNFTEYRINGDWDSIKIGINVATLAKCKTSWKYIPFKYNQNNIEEARALSRQFGIDEFEVRSSDRFDMETDHYKPSSEFVGIKYQPQINWKNNLVSVVDPECKNNKMHYISAEGYYFPCCYIGDYRFYYKTDFWKFKEKYSIKNTTFTQILKSTEFNNFVNDFNQQPVCQYHCPNTYEK